MGILNSLDMDNSLAGSGLSLAEALTAKAEAKAAAQERYSLAVGQQYSLAVFIGRITYQKGCDVIAEV